MTRSVTGRLLAGVGGLVLAGAVFAGAGFAGAGPAAAATATTAQVAVVSDLGTAVASPDGPTTLSPSGTGFQSIEGGFGGIYVLFGWISGDGWQPSAGGGFGATFRYQPDAASADNSGYQRFIAFPGSSTEGDSTSVIAADGTWAADLVVPGPVLTVTDAAGASLQLDCRVETCGVITIGAHGVVNPTNETFTPVSFAAGGGASESAGGAGAEASASAEATASQETLASEAPATEEASETEEAPQSVTFTAVRVDGDEGSKGWATGWTIVTVAALAAGAGLGVVAVRRRRSRSSSRNSQG